MGSLLGFTRPNVTTTNLDLVLDVDETLIHTFDSLDTLNDLGIMTDPNYVGLRRRIYTLDISDVGGPKGAGNVIKMWGLRRPHLREFLLFAFSYFRRVIIWSAGKYEYVHSIVKKIFRDLPQPDDIYTRDDCDIVGMNHTKPLKKIGLDLNSAVIVDDKTYTFIPNKKNGILIPPFNPELPFGSVVTISKLQADDISLLQLKEWLIQNQEMLNKTPDIRQVVMSDIFNIPLNELMIPSKTNTIDGNIRPVQKNYDFSGLKTGFRYPPPILVNT